MGLRGKWRGGRIAEGFEVLGPYGVYSKRAFIPGFAHGVLEEIGK